MTAQAAPSAPKIATLVPPLPLSWAEKTQKTQKAQPLLSQILIIVIERRILSQSAGFVPIVLAIEFDEKLRFISFFGIDAVVWCCLMCDSAHRPS